jgi:hypothetical protein
MSGCSLRVCGRNTICWAFYRLALCFCPREAFSDTQNVNRIREINQEWSDYSYRKIHWVLAT